MMRPTVGDVSGAVADLGTFVPLAAALVVVNGLEPGSLLLAAGMLVLGAGAVFRIPVPVQPLKALTALAVAQATPADVIHAAGLQIGVVLVLLSATGMADRLSRMFTRPVIRSLQFAVGILLVLSAAKLARRPPAFFEHPPSSSVTLALAVATLVVVAVAAYRRWYAVSAVLLAAGVTASWVAATPEIGAISLHVPTMALPPLSVFGAAFVLLVLPQLPLTYGNAVVGVNDLAREHFGAQARRMSPGRVALSCGLGNIASALMGGMPMCHGSSGLSAHIRLGARTAAMNVLLGGTFVVVGLVFSTQVLTVFGLLPVWALAGFLAYAGIRHAVLVLDLGGARLAIALLAGVLGIWTGNLAYTTAAALLAEHGSRFLHRPRRRPVAVSGPP